MKKNTVLSKILCVFKPKKTPTDILTEAENIINQYISHDIDFIRPGYENRKKRKIINALIIFSLAVIGLIILKSRL